MEATYDLTKMEKERTSLIENLNRNPRTFTLTIYNKSSGTLASPYLSVNNSEICCLIRGEQFKELNYNNLPPVCNVGQIAQLNETGKTSQPYLLTIGDKKFVLKIMRSKDPFIEYITKPPSSTKNITPGSCNYKDLKDYSYIASDEFTNEYLIGYLLDFVFKQYSGGLKNYVTFYTATICASKTLFKTNNYNIIMMEYCDLGSLNNIGLTLPFAPYLEPTKFNSDGIITNINVIKSDVLLDIFKQTITSLDFLQDKLQFVHGDLKTRNILLKNEKYSATYRGITINSPFTVKLADFGKSSMTMLLTDQQKPYRFYNYDSLASKYFIFTSFNPKINVANAENYYLIDNVTTSTLYAEFRHMGIPFYQTFDTYTFIISLLLIPEIFRAVFKTEFGVNNMIKPLIWDPLWFPDDVSTVYNALRISIKNGDENSMGTILSILKNIKLKCNITTNLVKLLSGN